MNERAVEASAQALFDRECARCVARGNEPHHKPGTLVKNMPHSYRDDYEKDAQAMLKAAEASFPGDIVEIEVPARSSTSKDGLRYWGRLVSRET